MRLQPYRQSSLIQRKNLKLSPCFYGPYQIEKKIGEVAYRLKLPPSSQIHNVFHVSQLKPKVGQHISPITTLPPVDKNGSLKPELEEILNRRMRKVNNKPLVELLIRWHGGTTEDASWEPYHVLCSNFPHLVGKVL